MAPANITRAEAFKGAAEVLVPDCINGGVEEGVGIAQPQDDTHHNGRHLTAGTEGPDGSY